MEITDANYAEVWKMVNEPYQGRRGLVIDTPKRLCAVQALQRDLASAMRFLDTTVECVPSVEVLERPVSHWGNILMCITTSKLDPE